MSNDTETDHDRANATGQQFLDEFGQRGGVWFAEGKTLTEARDLFIAELRAENAELRERLRQAGISPDCPASE